MSPIRYVDYTRAVFASQGFPPYEWIVNGPPPFTPFGKDLRECRVALLSTGGFYIKGKQPPFDPEKNDLGLREIPRDIDVSELAVSHDYYDHADAERDVNCVFPIQSVGLIARVVEESGIPTISVSSARDITELVKPPRSVFVNFPLGHETGRPPDEDYQGRLRGPEDN